MENEILHKLPSVYHAIQVELNSSNNRQLYRYLLIDRLAVVSELSLIYNEALQDRMAPELLAVVQRPELQHNLASCPLLVCLAEPNQPLNDELILASLAQINEEYLTSKQYVCGYLNSPLSPTQLADQLLESCLRAGKALNQRYFPFYEPFIMDLLWHSYLQPIAHLGLLLPKDTSYSFVDSSGDYKQFHALDYLDDSDFKLRFVNQKLHHYLLDKAILYHLLVTWQTLCEQQNKPLPLDSLSQVINYFYDNLATQLDNPQDRRAYVLFSLQYGLLTRQHELADLIQTVIKDPDKKGQLSYLLSQEKNALSSLKNLN